MGFAWYIFDVLYGVSGVCVPEARERNMHGFGQWENAK